MATKRIKQQQPVPAAPKPKLNWQVVAASAWLHALILIVLCIAVYGDTLDAPFVFDDAANIVQNPAMREFSFFANPAAFDRIDLNQLAPIFKSRLFGYFTFAVDYHLHGLRVSGYHVVNIAIHALSSIMLYALMLVTLGAPALASLGDVTRRNLRYAGLFGAMLFAVHPLETQAVTYISQRFASLASMLYIATIAAYAKARLYDGPDRRRRLMYRVVPVILCILAMKTKEIAFTIPVAVAVYERLFFKGTARERILWLLPLALTLLVIPLTIATMGGTYGETIRAMSRAGETTGIQYLLTQLRVIATYLRLVLLPVNQNVDYDFPLDHPALGVLGSAMLIAALIGLGVWLYRRARTEPVLLIAAYGIFWFFIALSVESSVVVLKDVIFEHRMYLPSAGLFFFAGAVIAYGVERLELKFNTVAAGLLIVIAVYGVAAHQRNSVWRSGVALWSDAVSKSPGKARVHNNLADAYIKLNQADKAIGELKAAIELDSKYVLAMTNLANVLRGLGRNDEALGYYRQALAVQPDNYAALNELGSFYIKLRDYAKAEKAVRRALELNPLSASAHNNMGTLYIAAGLYDKAVDALGAALTINPEMPEAHYNLSACYMAQGRMDWAISELLRTIELKPDMVNAHVDLGLAYINTNQSLLAIATFKRALALEQSSEIMTDLADAYQLAGESEEAAKSYQAAIAKDPANAVARYNYIMLLLLAGQADEALKQYEVLKQLSPQRAERLMSQPQVRSALKNIR